MKSDVMNSLTLLFIILFHMGSKRFIAIVCNFAINMSLMYQNKAKAVFWLYIWLYKYSLILEFIIFNPEKKYTWLKRSIFCCRIVGEDDGGKLFTPEEYEEYKRKVLPMRLQNRLYVSWRSPTGMDCKLVGPETLCFCTHR